MLVVPFAHDQPDNAARLKRLGVAEVLPIGRYDARRAADALRRLLASSETSARAARLGQRVQAEDGIKAACDALLGVFTRDKAAERSRSGLPSPRAVSP